jgi:hypothetical protein
MVIWIRKRLPKKMGRLMMGQKKFILQKQKNSYEG